MNGTDDLLKICQGELAEVTAENERLRIVLEEIKQMTFGKLSQRAIYLVASDALASLDKSHVSEEPAFRRLRTKPVFCADCKKKFQSREIFQQLCLDCGVESIAGNVHKENCIQMFISHDNGGKG